MRRTTIATAIAAIVLICSCSCCRTSAPPKGDISIHLSPQTQEVLEKSHDARQAYENYRRFERSDARAGRFEALALSLMVYTLETNKLKFGTALELLGIPDRFDFDNTSANAVYLYERPGQGRWLVVVKVNPDGTIRGIGGNIVSRF